MSRLKVGDAGSLVRHHPGPAPTMTLGPGSAPNERRYTSRRSFERNPAAGPKASVGVEGGVDARESRDSTTERAGRIQGADRVSALCCPSVG